MGRPLGRCYVSIREGNNHGIPPKINMVKLADSYLTSPGVARCLEPAILFPLEMQLFFFGGGILCHNLGQQIWMVSYLIQKYTLKGNTNICIYTYAVCTLQALTYPTLGKGLIIFNSDLLMGYVSSQEGISTAIPTYFNDSRTHQTLILPKLRLFCHARLS